MKILNHVIFVHNALIHKEDLKIINSLLKWNKKFCQSLQSDLINRIQTMFMTFQIGITMFKNIA